ncbi:low affinity iron permease family protein [Roseomonas xinghualingensis]|uniref:low affinity iron permease family protein n=1 Tax=Roseomonas xinghualingensis TaxID=2986475 RepID=UPI0021F1BF1F|nr:low affinity iron permease family protein [Roseomonas sp. SXEYE001]MCV4207052.1 low affinity iron permease family protein [Roseomonas sp. SXEYE001]
MFQQGAGAVQLSKLFSTVASYVAHATGRPATFVVCVGIILLWAVSGPLFGFSDSWQLVINTGTTIITFLMVFLIQNTQNRDGTAIQAKLDELIRSSPAGNAFIGIEHLTEEEVETTRATCEERARLAEVAEGRANRKAVRAADLPTS